MNDNVLAVIIGICITATVIYSKYQESHSKIVLYEAAAKSPDPIAFRCANLDNNVVVIREHEFCMEYLKNRAK